MNPIGAVLLACATAGFAWSAWASLRGRSRIVVVITLTAALAVLVSFEQLGRSTAPTEHASPPPSRPAGGHDQSPAPTVESATPPLVAASAVETPVPPVVAEPAVATPVPPVVAEPAVAPVAAEALLISPDPEAQPAEEEPSPAPIAVPPPAVRVPATVEAPPALLTAQTVLPPRVPSVQDHKKAPPGQEHPKKAKPASH